MLIIYLFRCLVGIPNVSQPHTSMLGRCVVLLLGWIGETLASTPAFINWTYESCTDLDVLSPSPVVPFLFYCGPCSVAPATPLPIIKGKGKDNHLLKASLAVFIITSFYKSSPSGNVSLWTRFRPLRPSDVKVIYLISLPRRELRETIDSFQTLFCFLTYFLAASHT